MAIQDPTFAKKAETPDISMISWLWVILLFLGMFIGTLFSIESLRPIGLVLAILSIAAGPCYISRRMKKIAQEPEASPVNLIGALRDIECSGLEEH